MGVGSAVEIVAGRAEERRGERHRKRRGSVYKTVDTSAARRIHMGHGQRTLQPATAL